MAKALIVTDTASRLNLSEAIEMSSQGTTSKTLFEELGVKQILFSMDTDEEMSSHASSFPATVHVLEGQLQFTLENETFELGPNDFLMMPSGAKHALKALAPMRFLLTLFKGSAKK